MAILNNILEDTAFWVHLIKNRDKSKWIGYELKILGKSGNSTKEILRLSNSNELYFENYTEPEIPALCNGLALIADGKIDKFIFEPIDEKDFRLELENENGIIIANIFLEEVQILNDFQWNAHSMIGVRMKIKKEDIVKFSYQLIEEYKSIQQY